MSGGQHIKPAASQSVTKGTVRKKLFIEVTFTVPSPIHAIETLDPPIDAFEHRVYAHSIWGADQQASARSKYAPRLSHECAPVWHVLDGLKRQHQISTRRAEREFRGATYNESTRRFVSPGELVREPDAICADVETMGTLDAECVGDVQRGFARSAPYIDQRCRLGQVTEH